MQALDGHFARGCVPAAMNAWHSNDPTRSSVPAWHSGDPPSWHSGDPTRSDVPAWQSVIPSGIPPGSGVPAGCVGRDFLLEAGLVVVHVVTHREASGEVHHVGEGQCAGVDNCA